MPILNALQAAASICAVVPTPSSRRRHASFSHGTKKRLTTNPGLSLHTMTTFPRVLQYCTVRSIVSWLVVLAGITSINLFLAGW